MRNECYRYAKSVADELSALAYDRVYKCPECGEPVDWEKSTFDFDSNEYHYTCGCVSEYEPEAVSIGDYINENALDIEYVLNSNKELIGVTIYVTLGGPTCYIDTRHSCVVCHWGLDEATVPIDNDTSEGINFYFEELF